MLNIFPWEMRGWISKQVGEELKKHNAFCCIHWYVHMNYSDGNGWNKCFSLFKIHLELIIVLFLSKEMKIMLEKIEKSRSLCSFFPESIESIIICWPKHFFSICTHESYQRWVTVKWKSKVIKIYFLGIFSVMSTLHLWWYSFLTKQCY